MNKETGKRNKKLYIALLIFSVVAIIAIVTTSIVIGLNSGKIDAPVDNPGGDIQKPDDIIPDPDGPKDPDDIIPNPDDGDDPTGNEVKYGLPLASYTEGQSFNVTELVWSNTLHWFATHNGTDFMAETGTIVTSICDGTVKSVKYTTQDGYVVTIENADGNTAIYKSLSADTLVEEGAAVVKGAQIGYVSDSMSSEQNEGPHLHLEMLDKNGEYLDPMSLIPAQSTDK